MKLEDSVRTTALSLHTFI